MTIELNGKKYVYDKLRNALYPEEGAHSGRVSVRVSHPETANIAYSIAHCASQLILQVTENCNLRCRYCCYSPLYPANRKRSDKEMTKETAVRAMDMFIARSGATVKPAFSFYGGEPLMNFELIRFCIEYIERRCAHKEVQFNITTNLTLLTEEILSFLASHRVALNVSLDGSRAVHDRCRVYPDGRGSFDDVYECMLMIKRDYPEYFHTLTYGSVAVDATALRECEAFFMREPLFDEIPSHTVTGLSDGFDETEYQRLFAHAPGVDHDADYAVSRKLCELFAAEERITGRRLHRPPHDACGAYFAAPNRVFDLFAYGIRTDVLERGDVTASMHHAGPCTALRDRMFVNADGDIYPCEKVNENCAECRLGNVHDGAVSIDKIEKLLNLGALSREECEACEYINFCEICAASLSESGHITREAKLRECAKQRAYIEHDIAVAKTVYDILSEYGSL